MSEAPAEKKELPKDLRNPDVVTKYKAAAEICNAALSKVITLAVDGATVASVCQAGDDFIMAETGKMWKKQKELVKGIAFPTCVSANHVLGHVSPFSEETAKLAKGDVVKIDLGVHFDGYGAFVAHTIVVGAEGAVTGAAADTILAAYQAAQVAARLLKAGATNTAITNAIAAVTSDFKVNAVQGVLSHNVEQYKIDGDKVISNKADPEHKANKIVFEENEVYSIDVVVSSGAGKPHTTDARTTVFKRDTSRSYSLKVSSAKACINEINAKFPCFPFTLRALDPKHAKLGIHECARQDIVQSYPVLNEKVGDVVAQFKFTALLMPSGTMVVTGLPLDFSQFKSDNAVTTAEYVELLKEPISAKKQTKKKADAPAAPAAATPEN